MTGLLGVLLAAATITVAAACGTPGQPVSVTPPPATTTVTATTTTTTVPAPAATVPPAATTTIARPTVRSATPPAAERAADPTTTVPAPSFNGGPCPTCTPGNGLPGGQGLNNGQPIAVPDPQVTVLYPDGKCGQTGQTEAAANGYPIIPDATCVDGYPDGGTPSVSTTTVPVATSTTTAPPGVVHAT